MKIYATYRAKRFGMADYNSTTLNGIYTPSFFLDGMFKDYKDAGLTYIYDSIIPEERYTTEIVPGIKKLTRFMIAECNDKLVDSTEFISSIKSVGSEFQIKVFASIEEARIWMRSNTDIPEISTGTFRVSNGYVDPVLNIEIQPLDITIE